VMDSNVALRVMKCQKTNRWQNIVKTKDDSQLREKYQC